MVCARRRGGYCHASLLGQWRCSVHVPLLSTATVHLHPVASAAIILSLFLGVGIPFPFVRPTPMGWSVAPSDGCSLPILSIA